MRLKRVNLIKYTAVFAAIVTIMAGILYIAPVKRAQAEEAPQLVTARTGLAAAVSNAAPGDTIYVGDMDFNFPAVNFNEFERVTINKSVTIKSGKPGGEQAVFTGGSFIIAGGLAESSKTNCRFEGIVFDGGIDGKALISADWEPAPSNHYTTDPQKAQYAVTFTGHVNAVFSDCVFTRYMYRAGAALWCDYGEFGGIGELNDNRLCKLDILLDHCDFTDNSAYYRGGALSLRAHNGNVSLKADGCNFTGNISADEGEGGGAVFSAGALIALRDCGITGNIANYSYGQGRPFMDFTEGGGIFCSVGSLDMVNCVVAGNTASNGGGIALHDIKANIDGCVIAGNSAHADAEYFDTGKGYGSMGRGGGIFAALNPYPVTIVNTSIYNNTALNAYGGLYVYYEDWYTPESGYGEVALIFCAYARNGLSDEGDYEMRWDDSGDLWENPHVSAFGCIIIDGDFTGKYPHEEKPSGENGYNYFAADAEGVFLDNGTDGYVHLSLKERGTAIPYENVKTVLSGRFANSIGDYFIGTNYLTSVTFRLFAKGSILNKTEFPVRYAEAVVLPLPVRTGYSFTAWSFKDGGLVVTDNLTFGGGAHTVEIYAQWEKLPLPVWAAALIIAGFISVSAAVFLAWYLSRRKKAFAAAGADNILSPADAVPVPVYYPELDTLTPREKEVFDLLIGGYTLRQMTGILRVKYDAVHFHYKNIYKKLNVSSRVDLIKKYSGIKPEDRADLSINRNGR